MQSDTTATICRTSTPPSSRTTASTGRLRPISVSAASKREKSFPAMICQLVIGVISSNDQAKGSNGSIKERAGEESSNGLAELNGHLVAAVAEQPGAHDLAEMRSAIDLKAARLSYGQRFAQEERDAAQRKVAREDL